MKTGNAIIDCYIGREDVENIRCETDFDDMESPYAKIVGYTYIIYFKNGTVKIIEQRIDGDN